MIFSTFEGKTWATTRIAGLFALLVLVFFSPALLNGRLLAPLGDGLFYYYPLRVYAAEVVSRGHLPLWNPLIFSGFPLLADIEVGVFYPPNWLFFILPAPLAMNLVVLLSYVIAGLSTYFYARAIGATPFGAVVSGLTFMLSGFMVSHLGHISIINAACWLPLLLFFLERMRQRVTWSLVTGGALTLGVQVLGSHPQIILYSLMVYVLYVGFFGLAHRPPSGRAGYLLGAAGVLGGGLLVSACQILPTWELASQSVRAAISYGAFTDHSLRLSHLLLFLFPYFFGGFSDGFYFPWWGYMTGLTEYSGYVGITPLLLILTVLFQVRRSRHVLFWLLCASFALLLALGENTPLYKIMYYVPLYNLFRASARHLLEVDLALAVLAGLGVTFLSQGYCRKPSLSVALAAAGVLAVVGGLCLLLVRKGPQFSALINLVPPPSAQVFTLANPALFLPLSFALLVCCSWFCYVCWPHRGMQAFTLFLLFADLGFFGEFCHWRFSSPTIDALQRHPLAVRSLKGMDSEMESYRLLSLSSSWLEENHYFAAINGANSSILQGIANASGSSSLMLTRYRAISDSSILHEGQALDLLNVRYLLVPDRLLSPQPEMYVQGVGFPREKLEVELSRNRPDRAELSLPPLWCSAIVVTSSSISGLVPDDHPLIKMTVWTKAGQRIERVLHAGWDMPEWTGERPWTWARVKHWLVSFTLPSKEGTYEYRSMCELGGRQQIEKIRFDYLASPDALRITQLAFYDAKTQHFLRIPRDKDKQTVRLSPPPHRLEVTVPSVPCSAVILTSALSGSMRIKQGQPVARVSVWTEEGEVIEKLLRAGEDTSEWAWERPDVRARVRHQKAPVAESFAADGGSYQGHHYLSRIELGGSYHAEKIALEYLAPTATLHIFALSLSDTKTGNSTPLPLEGGTLQAESSKPEVLQRVEFTLPPVRCSAIELISALENSSFVPQGQPVARVSVWTEEGEVIEKLLRAGEDTSEWAWERPDVRTRVKHQKAPVAESFAVDGEPSYQGHRYLSRLELGGSYHVERVQIAHVTPVAGLMMAKISLYDAETRHSLPLLGMPVTLANAKTVDQVEFSVPSVPCSAIAVISALGHSLSLEQGQPVARVSVWTEEGGVIEKLLRAGEDTSEWAWERPDVRAWVKYQKAPVAESFAMDGGSYQGHWYLGQLELGGRYRVERIKIAPVAPDATLSLAKISFYDKSTGTSTPFSLIRAYLSDQAQWQRRFSTEGVTVYENTRTLPRAWLVPRVQNLPARDILRTIRTGTLPDGTVFEPRHIALVENVPDLDFGPLDPAAEVEIVDYQPNRLTVRSQCRTASFLVMSEIAYPGWKAAIDGEPAPMVRTNYILRGLALPPGTHRIDFVYGPLSFKIGVAISGVTLLGLLGGSLVILLWSPLVCRSPKPIT